MRSITIGAEHFRTHAAATDRIRQILYSYPPHTPLAGPDLDVIRALLERHPRAVEKIGPGVLAINVRPNPAHPGNVGFWVTRTDGTATDFSFVQCLRPTTHVDLVRQALRRAIVDQVLTFKNSIFDNQVSVPCAVTGEPVTSDDCHVDHAPPIFLELADCFAEAEGGYPMVLVDDGQDGQIGRRLADPETVARWRQFHQDHAQLRIVSRAANLSVLRRRNGPC